MVCHNILNNSRESFMIYPIIQMIRVVRLRRDLDHLSLTFINHLLIRRLLLVDHMSSIMGQFIMDSGQRRDWEKIKVYKFGRMEVSMKDIGWMTKHMGTVDWYMQMEMFTMVNGIKIRHMAVAPTNFLAGQNMLEIGKTISTMGTVLKLGQMLPHMKATMSTERNTE